MVVLKRSQTQGGLNSTFPFSTSSSLSSSHSPSLTGSPSAGEGVLSIPVRLPPYSGLSPDVSSWKGPPSPPLSHYPALFSSVQLSEITLFKNHVHIYHLFLPTSVTTNANVTRSVVSNYTQYCEELINYWGYICIPLGYTTPNPAHFFDSRER